ncbi:MAG: alpha/beta hydrolase [Lachnospiraceae bacterium]|jgi:acetyl esterase|nr:alpha/beta hydrolase [Lachnospiraceae bacterium]
MERCVPLEPAARLLCNQSSVPPLIFQLPPEQGRRVLEKAQDAPVYKYPADLWSDCISTGMWGSIPVYFIAPKAERIRNIIFYIHGAGWVFGSFHTHEKLVRELSARTNSLVVFPEYSRSPEAKYPTAIEQCYFILSHIWEITGNGFSIINGATLTVAGDSVGGNMAIAMVLMSAMRHGPCIHKLLLYYPVTNACFDTPSYRQFAVDYYLYREGMKWFWRQYTTSMEDRNQITASPLRAGIDCLRCFPQTMIINGQADVLRSEGEAFAQKLRCAGVEVTALQIQGIIHDFVMLNALDQTNACRTAMDASTQWINRFLYREE